MPSFLGAADSFNSSSATIRPGPTRERERTSTHNAGLGVLGPQDSVGREFEALLSGRAGVLQSDAGVGDQEHLNRYLREYARMPTEAANQNAASPSGIDPTLPAGFNPLQFLNDPVAVPEDADFFAQVTQVTQSNLDAHQAGATASSPFAAIQTTEFTELYRPTSALSHHSHHSNASHHSANSRPSYQSHRSNVSLSSTDVDDSGFYTTDMDTDDAEFATGASDMQPSPSPLAEIGALNLGTPGSVWTPFDGVAEVTVPPVATISPEAEALGSSSRRAPPSKRSVRGVSTTEDEEKRRLDRLEHRRSINRRSAQKHRLRRKEELETLTQQIAERDQKIAALEKDLAVTKAQLSQLAALIKSGYQFGKEGGGAGGPAAGAGPARAAS